MKSKTIYSCTKCGYQSPKWLGKCPDCGAWNSFEEELYEEPTAKAQKSVMSKLLDISDGSPAIMLEELTMPEYMRTETGMAELDRVLGGGLVNSSVVLLAGDPGIGKSTLLLQITTALGKTKKVLYVSGEESKGQIKLRAQRLGISGSNLYIYTETNIENIISQIQKLKPDIVIVDSIQTVYNENSSSAPGSASQIKDAASNLISIAKNLEISMIIVGHVNKEGGIAGPKVLEHMVDAVLYFEGDNQNKYRIIRAAKNRFGSTNEIGVFEMTEEGLTEIPNPSEVLLSGRPDNVSGNCAVCLMEGTRPLIAEIQALASPTVFPVPRRAANGIDYNRMCLLMAVLEKRLGLKLSSSDIYLNVIGGLKIDEPAADMAIALSILSSFRDIPIPFDVVAMGEIGLAGETRVAANAEQRIKEAVRLGFKRIILPKKNIENLKWKISGAELIGVEGIYDALKIFKNLT